MGRWSKALGMIRLYWLEFWNHKISINYYSLRHYRVIEVHYPLFAVHVLNSKSPLRASFPVCIMRAEWAKVTVAVLESPRWGDLREGASQSEGLGNLLWRKGKAITQFCGVVWFHIDFWRHCPAVWVTIGRGTRNQARTSSTRTGQEPASVRRERGWLGPKSCYKMIRCIQALKILWK